MTNGRQGEYIYISFEVLANPITLENVKFLQGGDFVWICTMWFIQKHIYIFFLSKHDGPLVGCKHENCMNIGQKKSYKFIWIIATNSPKWKILSWECDASGSEITSPLVLLCPRNQLETTIEYQGKILYKFVQYNSLKLSEK